MKNILTIIVVVCCMFISSLPVYAQSTPTYDKGLPSDLTVSPPFINIILSNTESIEKIFLIKYKNFLNPEITFKYFESDHVYNSFKPSQLLQSILKIDVVKENNSFSLTTTISPIPLEERTYYFSLEAVVQDESKDMVTNAIGFQIPMTITINKSFQDPKPDIVIAPKSKIFFTSSIAITTQVVNQAQKQIKFAGKLNSIDKENYLIESFNTNQDNTVLDPKEVTQIDHILTQLPHNGIIPYFGSVDLFVEGTINNSRQIQTQKVRVWVIPYQFLIIFGVFCILIGFFIIRKNKKQKKLGKL